MNKASKNGLRRPDMTCRPLKQLVRQYLALTPIILLTVVNFACSRHCTKNLSHSPEVQGFRLGLALIDLQIRFPGLTVEQRPFGESYVKITVVPKERGIRSGPGWTVVDSSQYPELANSRRIILRLVDDELADFKIYYANEQQMDVDQFLADARSKLSISEGWQRLPGDESGQVFCDRFFVEAGMDRGENLNGEKLPYIEVGNIELLAKAAHRNPALYPGGSPRER